MIPNKSPSDTPIEDFYVLLGVEKTATEAEIKSAYRKLALKYHPDRNSGDEHAQELFKKISIAYSVLSDPNKRRQYDISGPSSSQLDFEGFDLTELGGVGRVFGALFTKLGVPIPTQIVPKVLAQARTIAENLNVTSEARLLQPGESVTASVGKQEAHFYIIDIQDDYKKNGISIICKSPSSSKFKLVLFDKEGGVRLIQESQKKKTGTQADMFFVPHTIVNIGEFNAMKYHMEDKDTPLAFHYLDLLETQTAQLLDTRKHILCVYGDNWLNAVKYSITFLPIEDRSLDEFASIQKIENILINKKSEMARFQIEYTSAKKKYEDACARLKGEDKDILEQLKLREKAYENVIANSLIRYQSSISPAKQSRGFLGLF